MTDSNVRALIGSLAAEILILPRTDPHPFQVYLLDFSDLSKIFPPLRLYPLAYPPSTLHPLLVVLNVVGDVWYIAGDIPIYGMFFFLSFFFSS